MGRVLMVTAVKLSQYLVHEKKMCFAAPRMFPTAERNRTHQKKKQLAVERLISEFFIGKIYSVKKLKSLFTYLLTFRFFRFISKKQFNAAVA